MRNPAFRISLGTAVGCETPGEETLHPRQDGARLGRTLDAEGTDERASSQREVETVTCRMQPAATTRQVTARIGHEWRDPLVSDPRDNSQKDRPAIRDTAPDARPDGRAQARFPESSPVGISHSSGSPAIGSRRLLRGPPVAGPGGAASGR